jgi:DNA-binding CsgD family transcriptional regulator
VHEIDTARAYCDELDDTARRFRGSTSLEGIVAFARGLTHLAANDAQAALGPLRRAFFAWQRLGAPYEEARTQVALARACSALGDDEGAARTLDAARETFTRLGAAPDLAALDDTRHPNARTGALSPRELQVLRLVATGMTNRAIAAELALSDKTIERHVSNIFMKITVSSRAAATAYAYEHGLIGERPDDG